MMQGRVADSPLLKQRAGVSARGRKLRNPYAHLHRHVAARSGPDPRRTARARRRRPERTRPRRPPRGCGRAQRDRPRALAAGRLPGAPRYREGGLAWPFRPAAVERRQAVGTRARPHRDRTRPNSALPRSTPSVGAPATCTRCRPLNGRAVPTDDLEPMATARTGRGSTNRNGGHPRRRRGRSGFGSVCSGACARRARRGTGPRATAERLVTRPRRRHGILQRTWARFAAAVGWPVDRFAVQQALDARLAAARLERVLDIRRQSAQCYRYRDGRRPHRPPRWRDRRADGPLPRTGR